MYDYIETHSGKQFHFMDPKPEEVDINDIAYALSNTCRWGGHCDPPVSVAQHCLTVYSLLYSWDAPLEIQFQGLLHDAAETYIPDIPTPIKPFLAEFRDIDRRIEEAIFAYAGCPYPPAAVVKEADTEVLKWEYRDLMPGYVLYDPLFDRGTHEIMSPKEAEGWYLEVYNSIVQRLDAQSISPFTEEQLELPLGT